MGELREFYPLGKTTSSGTWSRKAAVLSHTDSIMQAAFCEGTRWARERALAWQLRNLSRSILGNPEAERDWYWLEPSRYGLTHIQCLYLAIMFGTPIGSLEESVLRALFGERMMVLNELAGESFPIVMAFGDGALSEWAKCGPGCDAFLYVDGHRAGEQWSRLNASTEELERLRSVIEAKALTGGSHHDRLFDMPFDGYPGELLISILGGTYYEDGPGPAIDGRLPGRLIEEQDLDREERVRDAGFSQLYLAGLGTKEFWRPILGEPFEERSFRIQEWPFVLGFIDGALGVLSPLKDRL